MAEHVAGTHDRQPISDASNLARAMDGQSIEQHAIGRSIVLHLLPGAAATLVYAILAPILLPAGFPPLATFMIVCLFTILPIELGILFAEARRINGSMSLRGVVLYRDRLPWWQYIVFPIALLAWAAVAFSVLAVIDPVIQRSLFGWLPAWYDIAAFVKDLSPYSQGGLMVVVVLGIAFNMLAGPITEELYFRGYLLPRISRFGRWAPLINVVLFSLYHLWTPWQNVERILALLPMVYVSWWRKNIFLGMIAHVLLNTLSFIGVIALVLRALK